MEIRHYRLQDKETVKDLHHAGIAQMMENDPAGHPPENSNFDSDLDDIGGIYLNNQGAFLIGTEGNEIIAIGALRPASKTCAEIKRVRVRRDCQHRGYALLMVNELTKLAIELGYSELCLDTLMSNIPAQCLFEKCGFTANGRGKAGPYDLILYHKKLNEGGN